MPFEAKYFPVCISGDIQQSRAVITEKLKLYSCRPENAKVKIRYWGFYTSLKTLLPNITKILNKKGATYNELYYHSSCARRDLRVVNNRQTVVSIRLEDRFTIEVFSLLIQRKDYDLTKAALQQVAKKHSLRMK